MAEASKDDAADKLIVGRGPSYPFIDLRKAVERVSEVTSKGAERAKLAPESFYKFWGYAPKSSGARQTMAAMNAYGLVEYVGRGTDRRVQLTDCARRIGLDRTPGSVEKARALRQAALAPSIFADLWEHFGPHLPHDEVMASWLVLDRHFNQSGADAAIENFKVTVDFASLDKPDFSPQKNDSQVREDVVEKRRPQIGDFVEVEVRGQLQFAEPVHVRGISGDGDWFFVDGAETGYAMEHLTVVDPPADSRRQPPRMLLEEEKPDLAVNDLKPLFDFDSVTIKTKITSQWHLTELISRLEKLMPLLPPGAKDDDLIG